LLRVGAVNAKDPGKVVDVAEREKILDPTGGGERKTDTTLAPRPRSLEGLTVALVDNQKTNATLLLTEVARELQRSHGLRDWVVVKKGYFGTPVEESLIQQILKNSDFALAGIGD
jgi:hypothetical protein